MSPIGDVDEEPECSQVAVMLSDTIWSDLAHAVGYVAELRDVFETRRPLKQK